MGMIPPEIWNRFRSEVERCNTRLASELDEAWKALQGLLAEQVDVFCRAHVPGGVSPTLDDLNEILSSRAGALLIESVERYRRERPQGRAIRAFIEWDRTMEDAVAAMPEFVNGSAAEWLEVIGTSGMTPLSRGRLLLRRKPRRVPFRRSLLYGLQRHRRKRRPLEGRLMRILSEASLDLITPWQSMLRIWLNRLLPDPQSVVSREAMFLQRRFRRYELDAKTVLIDLQRWTTGSAEHMANYRPLSTGEAQFDRSISKLSHEYVRYREFWEQQSRAAESDIELECSLGAAEREVTAETEGVLGSIRSEHDELLDELNRVLSWLEHWKQDDANPFPAVHADLVPAASRMGSWMLSVETASRRLPEAVEVASRPAARPGLRPSWRRQKPRSLFQASLKRQGSGIMRDGLDHLERLQRSIVREIEHAREVVVFASETARRGDPDEIQIEREGVQNALSLLQFHRERTQNLPPEVERSFVSGLAAAFVRTHTILEEGQFGLARQAARHGLPAAIRALALRGLVKCRDWQRLGVARGIEAHREALIAIGWAPTPTARIPHVLTRGSLSRGLGEDAAARELPMIYKRLFQLAPVEDSRFLIGRHEEMAAITEARSLWERKRDAAIIIVGERGSGKTSLINCALQTALSGLQVVRGEFSERLTQPGEMFDFLAKLLDTSADRVMEQLLSERRVIVLEEVERTFLRRVNHYEALKSLLNVIAHSSRNNLWMVSTNYFSFRLLNATMRLDPHFSHRVNAMAVDRKYLQEAILMRHHLSGMRLRFAPAAEGSRRVDRLIHATRGDFDPEDAFFDAVYRESGGVFRSAFALWQRHIERSEAGVLYMRHPAPSQHESILKSLSDFDLFTLAAILQHGSLTPREHSLIFQGGEPASRAWLDNLLAVELIEPDPGRAGFRVVPEAGEVVRRVLFSRNVA